MKTLPKLFIIFLCFPLVSYPQKKNLSLEQVTIKTSEVTPQKLEQLQWIPGSNSFTYIDWNANNQLLIRGDVNSTEQIEILSLKRLNEEINNAGLTQLDSFPKIKWSTQNDFTFWNNKYYLKYNMSIRKIEIINEVPSNAKNIFVQNNLAAYTIDNNLFLAVNKIQQQITNDKDKGIVNGQTVHRNEFGITKGIFWSPDGNYLAFYRMDETMVTDYPIVDIYYKPAKLKSIKYPMAGMTSHQVTIGVYNLKNKETIWLDTGEPRDQYLTGVTWSPDEKYIYVGHLNRDQNHLRLIKYDASSGNAVKILFEEKDEKYVEPEHGPIFFSNDPEKFIWFSERDGWNHLYLYSDGRLIKQLTKGEWEVLSVEGFDEEGENIFFTATKESPIEKHYYKLNLQTNEIVKITNEKGTHIVMKNQSSEYFLDAYSNLTVPNAISLLNQNGKNITKIFSAPDPLENYFIGETKIFTLQSKNGDSLYCRIIYTPDFDSTKKYPVLVYVYGGPHDQLITNEWLGGASLWLNYMAENGYIVFTLDNHGSDNRGLKFEQTTFRKLGTVEIEDQILGVNYLKTLPYVDSERLGIHGWSYGGHMTTSLMTRTPGVFKVGVAGGAVIDWSYYEVMYTERYMDIPEANPEGYKETSLLNYVKDLQGKLLMVHGTEDPTVVWQHTLLFADKASKLGIPLDYFPYPGQKHGIIGKDKFHLYQKITGYFNEYLK